MVHIEDGVLPDRGERSSPEQPPAVCCAVVGTVWTPWNMCGHPAKATDANGRPICGIHRKGNPGIEWRGRGHRYPYGDGEGAVFKYGAVVTFARREARRG